jgi:glycosyltransferase involved in cell wall biosynthesis
MRLLLINSEYPPVGGGAGNATAHIARCFADMGHETLVITSRFEDLPHEERSGNLTVYRIPSLRRRQDRSGAWEQLIFLFSASFWISSLVLRNRPNATLAFFGAPSGMIAYLLKKRFKIPYVVSLRGGDVPGFRPYDFRIYHKVLAPFLEVVWRNSASVVANSKGLRDLARAFDSHFEIPIIPNGVDLDLYTSPQRSWQPSVLLSVGRLVYQKGFDLGIRALARLRHLDWQWHIAGDGPEMGALKALAREQGIGDRVVFLGWQSRQELIQCYKQSNLFLFPSRHEGMPNAVLEAMASGLPVIASRISGNEELVQHEKTGLLVESENVDALESALRSLFENPSLRKSMGMAARQRVEKSFGWENTARQYEALLENISSKRP